MLNFCTLFDSRYLSRGVAMYQSLNKCCTSFHLYIFAFDKKSYDFFHCNNFENVTVISRTEFEDNELLRIKSTRTKGEYCWTCTSSTILYVLNHYSVEICTYIDADLYFFSSPEILIDELGKKSILLTEHRYTPEYDQSATSGKYCVQFMSFRNDRRGREALEWWRVKCIEWCYNRMEDGKFGDQKYLDDWTERFEGVHVLQHLGGGVAPWNIQQYTFTRKDNRICGVELSSGRAFDLIFFHFHNLAFISSHYFSPTFYRKNDMSVLKYIFRVYVHHICDLRKRFDVIASSEHYFTVKETILHCMRVIRRSYRIKSELYALWYQFF